MKKIILIFLILLGLLIIAGGVFLATFKIDRYRPYLVKQLEAATGKPVSMEKLSFGWHQGLALEAEGFRIYETSDKKDYLFSLQSLKGTLAVKPLLERRIQLGTIIAEAPEIRLVREKNGQLRGLDGFAQQTPPAPSAGGALALLIQKIEIRDGTVSFRDETADFPRNVKVRDLDILLEHIVFGQAIPFKVSASFLSAKQNLNLSGQIKLKLPEGTVSLNSLLFQSDLSLLDLSDLRKTFPEMSVIDLREKLAGTVEITAEPVEIRGGVPSFDRAVLNLKDGVVALDGVSGTVRDVRLETVVRPEAVEIKTFQAGIAGGLVKGTGSIEDWQVLPKAVLQGSFDGIAIEKTAEVKNPQDPALEGKLSGRVQAGFQGRDESQILQTLNGSGEILVQDGVLKNLNLLREIFSKLSIIPGVVNKLLSNLPQGYQEKIQRRDTVLSPLRLPFTLQNGTAYFNAVTVSAEEFELRGNTAVNVQGGVSGKFDFFAEKDLSAAMIKSVRELSYLTDPSGRISIPVTVQGTAPNFKVLPDLTYVGSKLAVSKTQEIIGGFLEKQFEKKRPAAETSGETQTQDTTAPAQPADPLVSLLEQFLAPSPKQQTSGGTDS